MKPNAPVTLARLSLCLALVASACGAGETAPPEVRITAERRQVEVRHEGKPIAIERRQSELSPWVMR